MKSNFWITFDSLETSRKKLDASVIYPERFEVRGTRIQRPFVPRDAMSSARVMDRRESLEISRIECRSAVAWTDKCQPQGTRAMANRNVKGASQKALQNLVV